MIADKIRSPRSLKPLLSRLKKKGKRVAFTNGCFDIIHSGHTRYLESASKEADILIVALNDDNSVRRLKGQKRPIYSLKDRMSVVASLQSVYYLTYFSEDTPQELISYLRPEVLIKGADYRLKDIVGHDTVRAYGGNVKRIRYYKGYSVTSAIDRILSKYRARSKKK
jgi:D-beta-D-heptose 7-phosphate kinase/D-beta-D-heptose 1-phosphate adenosyltransferase